LRALKQLLKEQDPTENWGGLRRMLTSEGDYLWLCESCFPMFDIQPGTTIHEKHLGYPPGKPEIAGTSKILDIPSKASLRQERASRTEQQLP